MGAGEETEEKQKKRNLSHMKEHKSFLCFYYVNITLYSVKPFLSNRSMSAHVCVCMCV